MEVTQGQLPEPGGVRQELGLSSGCLWVLWGICSIPILAVLRLAPGSTGSLGGWWSSMGSQKAAPALSRVLGGTSTPKHGAGAAAGGQGSISVQDKLCWAG